jgi:mevalonate kinase
MSKGPLFYAKILLFGEYGIIKDSMGLSIPYNYYKGAFQFTNPEAEESKASNAHLLKYHKHLQKLQDAGELNAQLDLSSFKEDIDQGLHFDSSIPRGFGVGSSGALVAAIYDRYAVDKISKGQELKREDIVELKAIFSQMESYFHGKSSGIDPTICYLNLPLLIKSKDDLGTVTIPEEGVGEGAIFLINSGQPGETQPMVNIFMEKLKEEGFRNMLKEQFVTYNDACIKSFLKGDIKPLFSNLKNLSKLALDYFSPMIPSNYHEIWKKGIESNAFYLKLCGSGGGGFILGFTRDYSKAQPLLADYNHEVIYKF